MTAIKERVAKHEGARREKGQVKLQVWCYPEDRDHLRRIAEKLLFATGKRRGS